ncbi:MAG: Gfo/Idh/MocA family oxidoreductase [Anaerolineae bacterium]|nr:Gfo/Idh/MocA family oxidoreductase [Anaerolineae bacterium]
MADLKPLGLALVGAGAFGDFCLAAFAEMPEVKIAAIVDVDLERAQQFADRYQAVPYQLLSEALKNNEISIVALNTPPFLHAAQGLEVLNAKRHLFCEKPLALTVEDGEAMIAAATENGVLITVDYVMRQNPYWQTAAALAQSGILGKLRHMDLANHAAGLSLPMDHWFWNASKSGGIWIEHGVHFFDAFSWVADQRGHVVGSQAFHRSDGAVDRVEAILQYGDVAAHCYHAFDQSGSTEQTTVRLTLEHGYITLNEWVPTALELSTTVMPELWKPYLPGTVEISEREVLAATIYEVRAFSPEGKSAVYKRSIQDGMLNLVKAIRDPRWKLMVTGEYGLESLRTAAAATALA